MNTKAWAAFAAAREHYRTSIDELRRDLPGLQRIQQHLVNHRDGPAYTVETPIVYNEALDDVGPGDRIRLILVADNPGRREQAAENRRYLVGPSGKIAEGFFRDNHGLGIDFRRNVIILNKTPIHTPRTAELGELGRRGDAAADALAHGLAESQRTMGALLLAFHRALAPVPVWITGYSEMKRGAIIEVYTETIMELYANQRARKGEVFLYRHFSMNQFTIDLHKQAAAGETVQETLDRTGAAYRERVLGW